MAKRTPTKKAEARKPADPAKPKAAPRKASTKTKKEKAKASAVAKTAVAPAPPLPDERPVVVTTLTHHQIAERAFSIWKARGRATGEDRANWLEAEAQLRREHDIH